MKAVIYKYGLDVEGSQIVSLPKGASVLSVGEQKDGLMLWAAANPEEQHYDRRIIEIFGTGHPIEVAPRRFIGTVQCKNGLVWHVYERFAP